MLLWLLGAIAGGLAAWLTLAYGTPALTLAVVILIWSAGGVARPLKIAGVLFGAGATLSTTLALVALRCASAPGSACRAPDISGPVAVGATLSLAGLALTARCITRHSRRSA